MAQRALARLETTFVLPVRPPFRLDLTVWALRRRAHNQIDRWDGRVYTRLLSLGPVPQTVCMTVRQITPPAEPELQVSLAGGSAQLVPAVTRALDRMLGLSIDLSTFYALAARDPTLGSLVRRFAGLRPPRFPSLFEALVNAIACQQVTLTVGIMLLNHLAEAYGPRARGASEATGNVDEAGMNAFPGPEDLAQIEPSTLRPLGFSRQKAGYIVDLARSVTGGGLDLEALAGLADDQALTRLRHLRGIGRWSAEYVLLRGLGRLGVFPGDDVGARNNLRRWLDLPRPLDYEGVREVVAPWQPYAGLVYLHLLLASLAGEQKSRPEPWPQAPD